MAGIWYRKGTIDVTGGSDAVTGVGTLWLDPKLGPQPGNIIYMPDGKPYEVAYVLSNTSLRLATAYAGASASGAAYAIVTPIVGSIPALANRVAATLAFVEGQYGILDAWANGGATEDVTITNPSTGETKVVPSLAKLSKSAQEQVEVHAAKVGAHKIAGVEGLEAALADKLSITAGQAALDDKLSRTAGQIAYRNFVNNGGMQVSQRGSSFSDVGNGAYTIDRWQLAKSSGATVNINRRSDDYPSGVGVVASLEVTVATADPSIGDSEYLCVQQPMEGVNIVPLQGNTFTVSFWVKSTVPGVYGVSLLTDSPGYSFTAEYRVDKANTWEKKEIVVPGGFPLAYEMQRGNVVGMRLAFPLACGATYRAVAGSWVAGGFFSVPGQVNALASVNNRFSITAVQVELGGSTTPYEHKPFPVELAICQRYCLRVDALDVSSETILIGGICTASAVLGQYFTPVEMRVTPTWYGGTLSGVTPKDGLLAPATQLSRRGSSVVIMCDRPGNTANVGSAPFFISSGMNTGFRGFIAEL